MQILKDLQELLKKAIKEVADKESVLSNLKGELESVSAKKDQIEKDVQGAVEELKNINIKVREEKAREFQLLDDKSNDVNLLKAQAETELQKARATNVDLQNKLDAAASQKQTADNLLANLRSREEALEQRLAKLEEIRAAI